jgi:Transglutaminase-like superfamily
MMGPLSTAAELVERIRLVPDALREFTVGGDEAHALYGLDPLTLANLCDTGFPVSGCPGNARYDPCDLANAALHRGRRSVQKRAMVSWRQTLEEAAGRSVARYQITWPAGTSRRLALESAQTLAGAAPDATNGKGPDAANGRERVLLALATAAPAMPPDAAAVAEGLSDLQFFTLPLRLRGDVGFARHARVAGCGMAARLLVADLLQAGIEARARTGLLLAVPLSTPHNWIETAVDGTWVPYDPHLLRALVRHATLDPRRWHATLSPRCILAPALPGRGSAPLARESAELTAMTRLEAP